MYQLSEEALQEQGAWITASEIKQQPALWEQAFKNYQDNQEQITLFFEKLAQEGRVRVIFTGAGTSAYVGDTVTPYLKGKVAADQFSLESIPTTDLVSNPYDFYQKEVPTLLVSFARSGNSPESVAAVELGKQLVDRFYQLTITCAAEGLLAKNAEGDSSNLLLLMPPESNDKGFAMTGSYSCMALTTLLVFDTTSLEEKEAYVKTLIAAGKNVVRRDADLEAIVADDFERIVYLGSGSLTGAAREAQLKILELTAGRLSTMFDSSMGFRHGPKSFINDKTLVIGLVSNNAYTRQYDEDVLKEISGDQIASRVIGLTTQAQVEGYEGFSQLEQADVLPDAYLALIHVMAAQIISVVTSLKVGNKPDTPSPTGTVNRVVKGVIIHEFNK